MAVDMFLKLESVDGESVDDKHKGEIDIESFSWGESQLGTSGTGGGAAAGKVSMQDFHFVARFSRASVKLFLGCASLPPRSSTPGCRGPPPRPRGHGNRPREHHDPAR